jgi:mannose-6-phosphate isomerase class I
LSDFLRYVPAKAGDMVYVLAGMVHSLLDGIVVYEVQQKVLEAVLR